MESDLVICGQERKMGEKTMRSIRARSLMAK